MGWHVHETTLARIASSTGSFRPWQVPARSALGTTLHPGTAHPRGTMRRIPFSGTLRLAHTTCTRRNLRGLGQARRRQGLHATHDARGLHEKDPIEGQETASALEDERRR